MDELEMEVEQVTQSQEAAPADNLFDDIFARLKALEVHAALVDKHVLSNPGFGIK